MRGTCRGSFSALAMCAAYAAASLGAAELAVPRLELETHGSMEDGEYTLASHAAAELLLQAGSAVGGKLRFNFDAVNLEETLGLSGAEPRSNGDGTVDEEEYRDLVDFFRSRNALSFALAKVTIRDMFSLPLEFSYFVGKDDVFCSGDDFPLRFGAAPFATPFRGFAYDPDGIGGDPTFRYDGIHAPIGTGFSLALRAWKNVIPMVYAYQDSAARLDDGSLAAGRYSADLRLLVNAPLAKLETFVGGTTEGDLGRYRAGALAFLSSGTGADLLMQVGLTAWDVGDSPTIEDWFFLFEPRIDFGPMAIIVTLFTHPLRYLQRLTPEERGVIDINAKIVAGEAKDGTFDGGLESTVHVRSAAAAEEDNFSLAISPFLGFMTDGVRWDFKVLVYPLRSESPDEMVETSIGIRTAF